MFRFIWYLPRNAAILLIKLYQKTLSPDHGFIRILFPNGYCKFTPTCSTYAIESLKKHGFLKGSGKAIIRVFKCNPWSDGGEDLP
ncbi:membrane protein insertion efficiency factor YidD [Candidatus Peregrinibacteria bacterium]|nr:membrane protein insertion efficiency factor YidD [Candidatus Peregrinibacteria bacterium]